MLSLQDAESASFPTGSWNLFIYGSTYIKEDENSDVKWIDINKIKEYSTEVGMYPVYDKIIEKMKKNSYI